MKTLRYGLTEQQRENVFMAAGYANGSVGLPKSKARAWIDNFTKRLQELADLEKAEAR